MNYWLPWEREWEDYGVLVDDTGFLLGVMKVS